MSKDDLITLLGGARAIAARLGIAETAVCNWRHRGVPWRYRMAVASIADESSVGLPDDFIPMLDGANDTPKTEEAA